MADAEKGETKIEGLNREYWNTKKNPAKKGDQVKGIYVRSEVGEYPEGSGKQTTNYILKGDNGEIGLPNHVVLNGLMSHTVIGRMVRIVYLGKSDKQSRGRNAPELYDVFVSNQTNLSDTPKNDIIDSRGKLLTHLKQAPAGIQDEALWDAAFAITGKQSDSIALVDKLKAEGVITKSEKGIWTAIK